jgi:hypothetical protein
MTIARDILNNRRAGLPLRLAVRAALLKRELNNFYRNVQCRLTGSRS